MRIVEPMLLLLLAQEPSHGYKLAERLSSDFGVAGLPPQTVYRALQNMEDQGWILPDWDMDSAQGPPRKVFEITDEGQEALTAWSTEIQELRDMLDAFLNAYGDL
jgi:DNA-binding PadR family transcriptional regulator